MFGRLKDWRRIATRYDRCPKVFLSAVALASTVLFRLSQSMSLELNTRPRTGATVSLRSIKGTSVCPQRSVVSQRRDPHCMTRCRAVIRATSSMELSGMTEACARAAVSRHLRPTVMPVGVILSTRASSLPMLASLPVSTSSMSRQPVARHCHRSRRLDAASGGQYRLWARYRIVCSWE